jgi:hypothetical protein
MMKDFSDKAQSLLNDLESKRAEELNFLETLTDKYGEGQIDIFTLKWKKIKENGTN